MRIIMIFSALAAMSFMSPAADAKVDPPQRSIILSAGRGPFVFGRVVSLTVTYRNGGGARALGGSDAQRSHLCRVTLPPFWIRATSPGLQFRPHHIHDTQNA
jgi:hypothetical protein